MTGRHLEDYLAKCRELIRRHGHMVQAVMANPPWHYTVGLLQKHGYELIVFGLSYDTGLGVLNAVADSLGQGMQPPLDAPIPDNHWIRDYPVMFKQCEQAKVYDYVNVGRCIHETDVIPFRQLVLPDSAGRFPGEPGYGLGHVQPELWEVPRVVH